MESDRQTYDWTYFPFPKKKKEKTCIPFKEKNENKISEIGMAFCCLWFIDSTC